MRFDILILCFAVTTFQGRAQAILSSSNEVKETTLIAKTSDYFFGNNFTVIRSKILACPLGGGIFTPILDAWIVAPIDTIPVTSVTFSHNDTLLYFTRFNYRTARSEIFQLSKFYLSKDSFQRLFFLDGFYYTSFASGNLFLYGVDKAGKWHVLLVDPKKINAAKELFASERAIENILPVNPELVYYTVGNSLMKFTPKGVLKITTFDTKPDGLTVDDKGRLMISFNDGIIRFEGIKQQLITTGIHGKLVCRGKELYVYWSEENKIVCLRF